MKAAVIGSRTFNDFSMVEKTMNEYKQNNNVEYELIISGGARGADSLGEEYANKYNVPKLILKPDWKKHKKAAGFIRNKNIIDNAEIVFAFWDGKSKGTQHAMQLTKQQHKTLIVINF